MVDGREEEEREERVCREGLGEVGRKHAGKQQQPHAKLVVPFLFPRRPAAISAELGGAHR